MIESGLLGLLLRLNNTQPYTKKANANGKTLTYSENRLVSFVKEIQILNGLINKLDKSLPEHL